MTTKIEAVDGRIVVELADRAVTLRRDWALLIGDLEAIEMAHALREVIYRDVAMLGIDGPYTHALFDRSAEGDLGTAYSHALQAATAMRAHCEVAGLDARSQMPKIYVSMLQTAITIRQAIADRHGHRATEPVVVPAPR